MKNILSLLFISFFSISIYAQDKVAKIEFESETIDYGTIEKGSDGVRVFKFRNTGDAPLIVSNVKSSCGCTVPKKPNHPIMPGEEGKIEVSYDTKRLGGFSKAITIFSNAKNERKMVKIKGYIEKTALLEKKKNILSVDN